MAKVHLGKSFIGATIINLAATQQNLCTNSADMNVTQSKRDTLKSDVQGCAIQCISKPKS